MDIVYKPTFWMVPILNIIKGSLVHHYNQSLCSDVINDLSLEITESLEEFFRKDHNKDTNIKIDF